MKTILKSFFVFLAVVTACADLWAAGEIQIQNVKAREVAPSRFEFQAVVVNRSKEPREVTFRAQIGIFDRTVAQGDLPLNLFRKDLTLVLKPGEQRDILEHFVGEGVPPRAATRVEPTLRLRRQRVWNY